MSKRFLRQGDNCRGRGRLNPLLVRLMCGRISSNGKSRRRPAGVLAGNFFVKGGVFYKKKPLRPAAGAQLGKKLIRPPEEFCSKPYGMRKHCFPLLPANCRQAGFLNWANDVNPHGGVIDLAGCVVFIFSPSSIKVYYTNRQVQIEGAAFYRRPIKLSGCEEGQDGVILGWRALPFPGCDWACQTLFFS